MGVEGWSQKADEAEELAHRLLDALRPSDSEVRVWGAVCRGVVWLDGVWLMVVWLDGV